MTVRELIEHSELCGLRCIVGEEQLDREITSVNIMDNPNVYRFLKPGEIVLSTGYLFQNDSKGRVRMVREAARIGCVAMGIKIKRFIDEVPQDMLEEARACGLPLFEIPFYYPLSEFSRVIFETLVKEKMGSQVRMAEDMSALSDLYFQGCGLETLCGETSARTGKRLYITNKNRLCLCITEADGAIRDTISPEEQPFSLENAEHTPFPVSGSGGSLYEEYRQVEVEGETFRAFLLVLPADCGYLCVPAAHDLSADLRSTLRHAARIAGLMLSGHQTAPHSELADFFYDFLMSDRINDRESVIAACRQCGFEPYGRRICLSVLLDGTEELAARRRQLRTAVSNQTPDQSFVCSGHDIVSVFLFLPERISELEAEERMRDIATRICARTAQIPQLYFGIGHSSTGELEIAESFHESIATARLARRLGCTAPTTYSDLFPCHLLSRQSERELRRLVQDTIEPLLLSDQNSHTDLILTLDTYLDCRMNATATAKRLFLHRNTLLGRLDKISELTGMSLQNRNHLQLLQSAIFARRLLQ